MQVDGSGFASGATIAFSGTGISVTGTTWVSNVRIDVTVDVTDTAATGPRSVTVTNPDASTGTGVGVFSITAPSISISLSSLGYADAARDSTAPYQIDFGLLFSNQTRSIGPTGSGQLTPGAAMQVRVISDTHTVMLASATTFAAGAVTMPAAQVTWKHHAVVEAWTAMTTSSSQLGGRNAPGTSDLAYDLRLTIPAAQAAGTYSSTATWTALAAP